MMLHVTNGDASAERIAASGLAGSVLPWRDVLHEGPIPAGLGSDELRAVRARFIASRGWGSQDRVPADFARRDEMLAGFRAHQEVVLWFEHDLYDQLQLIQILDRFAGQAIGAIAVSLICISGYPGVSPFYGLGDLTPAQIATLFPVRRPVTADQFDLARAAWVAVSSPVPTTIERLIAGDTRALPFLGVALRRLLEEFPGLRDGLSRTERQAMKTLSAGAATPAQLFHAAIDREERPFLGDLSFWGHLQRLAAGSHPLVAPVDGRPFSLPVQDQDPTLFLRRPLEITTRGRAVVAGEVDQIALNGIDRWFGGVHLAGRTVPWRWDDAGDPARLLRVA